MTRKVAERKCINIISADPGAGKTRFIVESAAYFKKRHNVPEAKMLAITFSKSMAADMCSHMKKKGLNGIEPKTLHASGRSQIVVSYSDGDNVCAVICVNVVACNCAVGTGSRAGWARRCFTH